MWSSLFRAAILDPKFRGKNKLCLKIKSACEDIEAIHLNDATENYIFETITENEEDNENITILKDNKVQKLECNQYGAKYTTVIKRDVVVGNIVVIQQFYKLLCDLSKQQGIKVAPLLYHVELRQIEKPPIHRVPYSRDSSFLDTINVQDANLLINKTYLLQSLTYRLRENVNELHTTEHLKRIRALNKCLTTMLVKGALYIDLNIANFVFTEEEETNCVCIDIDSQAILRISNEVLSKYEIYDKTFTWLIEIMTLSCYYKIFDKLYNFFNVFENTMCIWTNAKVANIMNILNSYVTSNNQNETPKAKKKLKTEFDLVKNPDSIDEDDENTDMNESVHAGNLPMSMFLFKKPRLEPLYSLDIMCEYVE